MATSTTNFGLTKPAYSESADVAVINGNMDTVDTVMGVNRNLAKGAQAGLAIVADGDTHAAITAGQYVYVRNNTHSLAEGLYVASANVSANGNITGSNMTAVSGGGLNALNSKIANFNSVHAGVLPNTTYEITLDADSTYLISHMTSSDTSQRLIMIMVRNNNYGVLELGKGSWQSYYTETIANGKWSFANGSYNSIVNYIKF